jgi:acyl carrier protein
MSTTHDPSFDLVRDALIALDIPAEEITPDVNIRDELDVDSTELVEIAVTLGGRCGTEINAKSVKDVETVRDLVALLEQLRAATV